MRDLEGKVGLVTGASRGLEQACCELVARAKRWMKIRGTRRFSRALRRSNAFRIRTRWLRRLSGCARTRRPSQLATRSLPMAAPAPASC